jgi:hypothetical protein
MLLKMHFLSALLLLCSTLYLSVSGLPQPGTMTHHLKPRVSQSPGNTDSEVIASYSQSGMCFQYVGAQANHDKSLAPCKIYCNKTDPGNQGYSVSTSLRKAMHPNKQNRVLTAYAVSRRSSTDGSIPHLYRLGWL